MTDPPEDRRSLFWALVAGALVVAGIWAAVSWVGPDEAEERAEVEALEQAHQATVETLEETADSLEEARQVARARKDSIVELNAELVAVQEELTHEALTTLDTARAQVPDSVKHLIDRAQRKVEEAQEAVQKERRGWRWIHDQQAREIVALEARAARERAGRLEAEEIADRYRELYDPPWYKELARGLPEGLAKVGGGVASCLLPPEEARLWTCGGYTAAVGIDVAF